MFLKLVENLRETMRVRMLRNSCREYLTNHREYIGVVQQLIWYFRFYRHAKSTGKYRLYLWYDDQGSPVGYGALSLEDGGLGVTECVATNYRRMGHGRLLLEELVRIAAAEKRDVVAEIWATNEGSISLHEKAGFKLESNSTKQGSEIRRYRLTKDMIIQEKRDSADRSRIVA